MHLLHLDLYFASAFFSFFRLSEEKRRQLELAKLRLLQRTMQRENNLQAIAQIMAMSKLSADRLVFSFLPMLLLSSINLL